jgi:hypothetical protein
MPKSQSPQCVIQALRNQDLRPIVVTMDRMDQVWYSPNIRYGLVLPLKIFEAGLVEGELERCIVVHRGLDNGDSNLGRL